MLAMQANPLWPVTERFPVLERDANVDVAIIGAGIAGISCAFHLQEAGFNVLVLERDELGSAATGASSGILYYGSGGNFVEAVERYGLENATMLWKETERTIAQMASLIEKNGIECGFRHTGAIMVAKNTPERSRMEKENAALAKIGIRTELCSTQDIERCFTGNRFAAGLTFEICSVLHPAQFAAGIAKQFNVPVFEKSPMRDFVEARDHVIIQSSRAKVRCGRMIVATNLEPLYGLEKHFEEETTVVIASREIPEIKKVWPEDKVIWTMEEYYDILYPLGRRLALELYKPKEIRQKLAWYYNGIRFEREHQWGDSWSKTKDLLPIIGRVSNLVHAAVAMGDEGIVMGFVAGSRMPLSFEDRVDPILKLTSPKRFA
jgi:glycine/D-amino acid oxidase-like deaminating enzyme